MEGRFCRRCGALLAADHTGDDWCTPCLRSRRDYDPRDDPFFLDELLHCLVANAPERTEPLKAMGLGPQHRNAVKDGIRTLRRKGFDIRATERFAGYRYFGFVAIDYVEVTGVCATTGVAGR